VVVTNNQRTVPYFIIIFFGSGGIAINKNIVIHLLNRLKDFNEWGQTVVLDTVSKYEPSPEEVLDILVTKHALCSRLFLPH